MKTSELTEAALDWAVAKCEFDVKHLRVNGGAVFLKNCDDLIPYHPSTNWTQGGPIIEREYIGVNPRANRTLEECWSAQFYKGVKNDLYVNEYGPTPLIAAMRCYVASKLGDDVDVPKELVT